MQPYENIMGRLLKYTYTETFENIFEPEYFLFHQKENYCELLQWNMENIWYLQFDLNHIKHYITANKFFYYMEDWRLNKHERLLTPNIIESLTTRSDIENYRKLGRKIRKNVKFTQIETSNKIATYILFLNIVTDINLFLVIDPHAQSYIITDDINLHKEATLYFLCINIRHGLDWILSNNSSDYIQSIKDKYEHLRRDKSMKVFQDIQEAIKTNANLKIKIDISKWDVNYFDAQFRDQDLSKIHEYKKFMNEGNVTASTTIEEYKGKPSAIVWHRRKKYK